jgi:hypothetical protein
VPSGGAAGSQKRIVFQRLAAAGRPGAHAVGKGRVKAEPFAKVVHGKPGFTAGGVRQQHAAGQ